MDVLRRRLLQSSVAGVGAEVGLALAGLPAQAQQKILSTPDIGLPPLSEGAAGQQTLEALNGKVPLIAAPCARPTTRRRSSTWTRFSTPARAFFVRYHLANIPEVEARNWRLLVGGEGAANPGEYSLDDLKRSFEVVEVAAVCQCSGNRQWPVQPHVPGVQWCGAMGNARWRGVRLRDVLNKAGLKKEAIEVSFAGADGRAAGSDAEVRQEHPDLEGDRSRHADCVRDERRGAAALERLSGTHRRARLDRDLLDEARDHDTGLGRARIQFLE